MAYVKPKTIAIICARGGSKGLVGKNLKLLNGEPLIGRAIRHAKAAQCIDHIIVSTDDEEIAAKARDFGAVVPFTRPANLAEDLTSTEEALQHALLTYEDICKIKFEIAVFLTATDIFRNPNWISIAVEKLIDRPELESVFVGYETHKNFWEKQKDGTWVRIRPWMANYASRQDSLRGTVVREDTGLACASRASLWRKGKRIGDKVEIIVTNDDFTSIDIHEREDLLLAEAALEIRKEYEK